MKLFRYSGNKVKLTPLYDLPKKNISRIVEPYLGSAGFSLNCGLNVPVLGYEINEDLYDMWMWLKSTSKEELLDLYKFVEDLKTKEEKPNLKNVNLPNGPLTYIRINACSVVVGQLSSWKVYPQHKLPIQETIRCLPIIKDFEIRNESAENYENDANDLVFIDPPYLDTKANYKSAKNKKIEINYKPEDTINLVSRIQSPIIFTYGSNAMETFPNCDWRILKTIKVPNIRKGGTVDRFEYVAYLNYE